MQVYEFMNNRKYGAVPLLSSRWSCKIDCARKIGLQLVMVYQKTERKLRSCLRVSYIFFKDRRNA